MTGKIGFITYALDRARRGTGRYTWELLAAMQANGLEPTILQAGRTGEDNTAVFGLPGSRLLPGLLTIGQVEIARVVRSQKIELIHDPTGSLPVVLAKTRKVATIHDTIPYIYPQASTFLDWLLYRFWLPLAVRCLDAIITVSQRSRQDILRFLPVEAENVMVVPEAASSKYRPLEKEEIQPALVRARIVDPYILYVGSIEPRKNLLRLLEAYARLRDWSPKWALVIVGARNLWKSSPVAASVRRLKLESYVHFTGYIPEEDLPALYNGADLFVFPSLYEGFGLPVLEAMACGTPVVTSRASSLPEVAGNAALLVDPYNVDEIALAMQRILGNPDLAEQMRVKGLARAQMFNWGCTARETVAVYERVLGRRA